MIRSGQVVAENGKMLPFELPERPSYLRGSINVNWHTVDFTIPTEGNVFISVNDFDKAGVLPHARALHEMGLHILATRGTAEYLNANGVEAEMVYKVLEGRPNVVDLIKDGRIRIVFNTPLGGESFYDDGAIRKSAVLHNVLVVTTLTATAATVQAIRALRERATDILSLQEIHAGVTS